ncbi:MAG: hypothetical protein ABL927_09360 [Bdellovibrionales bacterium]
MDLYSIPRDLEKQQLVQLMSMVAEAIFIEHFDPAIGLSRVESKIQKGEDVPEGHIRAHRMAREEILYSWLGLVHQIIKSYFITTGKPIKEDRLLQYRFPEPLWENIERFLENLKKLPLWVNRDLASSIFGGRQNYDFWHMVFETGKTPQGQVVMPNGVDLMKMISR